MRFSCKTFLILNGDLRATQRSEVKKKKLGVQFCLCFPSLCTVSATAFLVGAKVLCRLPCLKDWPCSHHSHHTNPAWDLGGGLLIGTWRFPTVLNHLLPPPLEGNTAEIVNLVFIGIMVGLPCPFFPPRKVEVFLFLLFLFFLIRKVTVLK